MKIIQIIFLLLVSISCDKIEQPRLESSIQIVTKYQTLDEHRSPNFTLCTNKVQAFKKMGKYDCAFLLEKYEFDIEEKFILDTNGNIKAYWTYLPEGPLTYSIDDLKTDPKFLAYIGGSELNIHLLKNNIQIVDKGDTLTIENIFPREKLILMKQTGRMKKKGKRVLYEYK